MLKTYLSCFISGLLLLGSAAHGVAAGQQGDNMRAVTVEGVKIKVSKLGVGEKARATITLKDGTKTKGYVARAGEEDFVLRDRKTDNATIIRYSDVASIESHRGHSTAKHIGIGVGVGVGAFLAVLLIIFSRLD